MRVTAVEFAEAQGIQKPIAAAVLKFLEGKGAVQVVDKRRAKAGRGRSSKVYEVAESLTVSMV